MNCTKDCEEYEKPSVMLQGTSGIRPGGGDVAKCRKLSRLVIMIWWYSNIIDTKTNQKLTIYTSWGGPDNIDDVAELVGPRRQRAPWQHFLRLPSPTLRCHEVEQIDCSLPQSHLSPASNLSIWKEFHVTVKERAINHHGFVLVHTSHTRLDPSEDLQSSQEDTWQSEGVGKIWTKTLQYLAHNSLTAFRPTAITSEEFLSVTKLLMIALRTGSRQSGGTISWAACAENKSNLMNWHWWRARSLQYF